MKSHKRYAFSGLLRFKKALIEDRNEEEKEITEAKLEVFSKAAADKMTYWGQVNMPIIHLNELIKI